MEEDYNNFVQLIRTYLTAITKLQEMYFIVQNKVQGLNLEGIVRVEGCNSLVHYKNDTITFYTDVEGNEYYPVIKMSSTHDCQFYRADFDHYPNTGKIGHAVYSGEDDGTINFKDRRLPRLIRNIDEFTPEQYFQYSTILDDRQMFLYICLMCCTFLDVKFCIALQTDYYSLYNIEYAEHMISTINSGLENLTCNTKN